MSMHHQAADQTQKQIDDARLLLKPSPVELHHVPDWFRRALLKAIGCCHGDTSGWGVLNYARQKFSWTWLDHFGSTTLGDRICFVSEPYNVNPAELQQVKDLAEKIGCQWYLCANSWWYPGSTLRIVFDPGQ